MPGDIPQRPLYQYAYIPDFEQKLDDLAALAEPEDWTYKNTPSPYRHPILYYYVHYTFVRLQEEEKVAVSADNESSCFNTGLVTSNQEPIYALFVPHRYPDRAQWYFERWARKGEAALVRFPTLPDIAHYFEDPSQLVFDSRLELRSNIEHIIGENQERFPEPHRLMGEYELQTFLRGAIETARERVRRNYKAAVPQYYRGHIQLLLPLCLKNPTVADLALVVERHEGFYRASTCLTLDMAYNNARQLARPDKDWLQP